MARIIVTTCGTSLLESSCWTITDVRVQRAALPISTADDWVEREKRKQWWREYIIGEINNYKNRDFLIKNFNKQCWDNTSMLIDLPAELASLQAIALHFGTNPQTCLNKDDKVILIGSDNTRSKFCVKTLMKIITEHRLLPTIVEQKLINDLDPTSREKFKNALAEMGNYVSDIVTKDGENNFNNLYLNLTGGYKALAIQLSRFSQKNSNTTIFYLFEETNYKDILILKNESIEIRRIPESASPP